MATTTRAATITGKTGRAGAQGVIIVRSKPGRGGRRVRQRVGQTAAVRKSPHSRNTRAICLWKEGVQVETRRPKTPGHCIPRAKKPDTL